LCCVRSPSPAPSVTWGIEVEQPDAVGELRGGSDATAEASAERRKQAREAELEAVRRSIEVSTRRQQALREEIGALESDREKLSADLIATAQRLRRTEEEIRATEVRLEQLHVR
jgi:septal ring factor EnvC (AmiA/AmiB activator)